MMKSQEPFCRLIEKYKCEYFLNENVAKMNEMDEYDDEMVIPRIPGILVFSPPSLGCPRFCSLYFGKAFWHVDGLGKYFERTPVVRRRSVWYVDGRDPS